MHPPVLGKKIPSDTLCQRDTELTHLCPHRRRTQLTLVIPAERPGSRQGRVPTVYNSARVWCPGSRQWSGTSSPPPRRPRLRHSGRRPDEMPPRPPGGKHDRGSTTMGKSLALFLSYTRHVRARTPRGANLARCFGLRGFVENGHARLSCSRGKGRVPKTRGKKEIPINGRTHALVATRGMCQRTDNPCTRRKCGLCDPDDATERTIRGNPLGLGNGPAFGGNCRGRYLLLNVICF